MPCAYADTREVTELCKVAAKNNVPFVIHQRSEADTILDSMREVIAVGRDSGVWVHFSHFKLCGKNNAHLFDQVLGLLDQAQKEGIGVSFDQYPYVAGSTMLGVILPPWVHDGGTDKLLERLAGVINRDILAQFPLVEKVTTTVHKPGSPIPGILDDVSVTLTKERQ